MALKEINVSKGFENYSQRNNEVLPSVACGPTNMVQALEYSGWELDKNKLPELSQPEDKLMKFTRTNETVLKYYETKYKNMYKNWVEESKRLKADGQEIWQVDCPKANAPNEVHDVMNFATNVFLGYSQKDIEEGHFATWLINFDEDYLVEMLKRGLPVVTSVRFKDFGHYITIVGAQYKKDLDKNNIENYIIDNTYGRFDFKREVYEKTSGNDNLLPRKELLARVRPVMHCFRKGAIVL